MDRSEKESQFKNPFISGKIIEGGSDSNESEILSAEIDQNKLSSLPEIVRTIESGPVIHLGHDGEDAKFRSVPDDLDKVFDNFFKELNENSIAEPALESVPANLDEIMADFEKEMASGSGAESKEEKAEVVGGEFANTVRENFEEKKKEVGPNSRWSFVKERLRGVASLGLYEFSSATKLWWNTNRQGKKIKKASESLEEEMQPTQEGQDRNMLVTLSDNEKILNKLEDMGVIDEVTKEVLTGLSEEEMASCIENATRGVVSEKIEKNDLMQEKIITDSLASFESKFKNTKTYRGQKIGAEKIKEIEEVLQDKLAGIRTGRVQKDLVAFNKLIREKVDAEWYKRYVAGGIEMALASALIVYIKPLVAKNLSLTAIKAGSNIMHRISSNIDKINQDRFGDYYSYPNMFVFSNESTPLAENLPVEVEEDVVKMKKTVWHSVKDYLKLNGVKNPTDVQIMEASKLVAENNDIGVKAWGIEGKNLDTKLKAGFSLNMAGVGEMAVKWGGKKMTREAWRFIFESIAV